jgi:restriction system protein
LSIPDFQSFMLPVLRVAAEGEVRISDVVERLADEFALSAEDRSQLLPSGKQTTFANRVHWAKSYLGKAGLVELTKRAHFRITEDGRKVLATSPQRIDVKFLNNFPSFQKFHKAQGEKESGESISSAISEAAITLTPDEVIRKAHGELESALADDLIQRIRASPPAFFEKLVVQLLLGMGYGGSVTDISNAFLVGGTGDGGVDGVIDQDPLGLDRIYVQAKRYADGNTVSASAIRDFFGSLDRFKATKGLFVTASTFTKSARDTAAQLSKRIVLIDGDQLTRLMIRHGIGCRIDETLHIKSLDEEFFD